MTIVALDVADVARVEVRGLCFGAGSEHSDLRRAFDVVLPLIGIGMPMQLAQAAGDQSHERGGDVCVGEEVPAVGDLHRTTGPLAKEWFIFDAFQGKAERVFRWAFGT